MVKTKKINYLYINDFALKPILVLLNYLTISINININK